MGIRFENTVTPSAEQWRAAIMGARNPMNSWQKSDSAECRDFHCSEVRCPFDFNGDGNCYDGIKPDDFIIGPNDLSLLKRLCSAGTDHRKFMRMLPVMVTITAPLYWWKEFSTYKVGTVANSCSTMHKIADKEFTIDDFSHEHLDGVSRDMFGQCDGTKFFCSFEDMLYIQIEALNEARKLYLETSDELKKAQESYIVTAPDAEEKALKIRELQKNKKTYWWQMIQLLPSSYNQKRTVMCNYEVLANIYKSRKYHKLDEWKTFCNDWIKNLPYAELITGEKGESKK